MNSDGPSVGKVLGVGFILITAVTLFFWTLGAAFFDLNTRTSDWFGRGRAEQTVNAAPFRLVSYDHFYELCASVQSRETAIDAQSDALANATTDDARNRANTNLAANQALRGEAINDYNADARKENTEGQYRAAGLPYQIPVGTYAPYGEKTTCGL